MSVNENTGKSALTTLDLCYVALSAALIAVCSQITVPLTVLFTMQTFGVFFALGLLGGKKGFFAVLTYILLGAVGVPVFAQFSGGFGVLVGLTGGYITGFLLAALLYAVIPEKLTARIPVKAAVMAAGLIVCYLAGTVQFTVVSAAGGNPISFVSALGLCVFPFIIPDIIKISLAIFISERIKKYVRSDVRSKK